MTDEALRMKIEALRAQLATSEQCRFAFAEAVKHQALAIGECCAAQDYTEAMRGSFKLSLLAASEQTFLDPKMKSNAIPADASDLASLRVDAASASNSETGWERED